MNNQTLETEKTSTSYNEQRNTSQKSTTKQTGDRPTDKSEPFAAASLKSALEEEKSQTGSNPYSERVNTAPGQKKVKSEATQSNSGEEKSSVEVDYIVTKIGKR